ncbi:hypothetical protein OHA60_10360 [Streptomyces cellulosae]|nr:hypothetical protein OHA60_10360 [Streptomyces cellulosae]
MTAEGVKHSGESFEFRQYFGPGVWAIAHPANSAGKTSLLEFLVWPLRGAPRDLPPDVRSWLRTLRLDVTVAGRPACITMKVTPGERGSLVCCICTADTEQDLLTGTEDRLRLVAEASGMEESSRTISAYLMDALRMEHTSLWQAKGGADGEGAAQVHGWPSYFGACYLNPGGDEILLGDVSATGLPGKLLELFIDIPYSTTLAQLSVAGKRERKVVRQQERRAQDDAAARRQDREAWRRELDEVRTKLSVVRAESERDVTPLLQAADAAGAALQQRRQELEAAEQALAELHTARIRAQQAQLDAQETWQARRVLGRLDPVCCPRCEEPLEQQRRAQEKESAACAVCTRPLPEVDADTAEAVFVQLEDNFAQARAAEEKARAQRDQAQQAAEEAASAHQRASAALQEVLAVSRSHALLRELELRAAVLEGQLAATGTPLQPVGEDPATTSVLSHVEAVVRAYVETAARHLFPAMNAQIVELATRFGVQNLDRVSLDRAGRVNAVKAGVPTTFKRLSRGDRLRMRIATVIALLRVGAARGVATHPGLLLIDSVAAEEVTEVPARTLIAELQAVAQELPDLQVVLTTAQPELVEGLLPSDHIITSRSEHLF